jgi:hypothetical protein
VRLFLHRVSRELGGVVVKVREPWLRVGGRTANDARVPMRVGRTRKLFSQWMFWSVYGVIEKW